VGHDTEAVRNLCTSALLLDGGLIIERGDPNTVVNKYYALIAERERAYSEGTLIEHGDVPGDGYETAYDFIQNISEAKIESVKGIPVESQTVEIQSTPRKVIFAHAPSKITYTITVGQRPSLAFAIGILPAAWDNIPQGVKFDIEVFSDGIPDTIFSRVLQPKRNVSDRGWHNFLVSLGKYSNKTIFITLKTSGSGEDLRFCWSAWGWISLKERISESRCNNEALKINSDNENENDFFTEGIPIRYGNKKITILNINMCDSKGDPKSVFSTNENVIIKVTIKSEENIDDNVTIGCSIRNKFSVIYGMNSRWQMNDLKNVRIGDVISINFFCCLRLGNGIYSVTPAAAIVHSDTDIEVLDRQEDQLLFQVTNNRIMEGIVDLGAKITWTRE
jgi:hypothetical protein